MTRGFALLTVLWLLAVLSAALAVGGAALRDDIQASRNRVLLTRAHWAADACVAVAMDHGDSGVTQADTVDLGRGTRCSWRVDDPARYLDVNHSDSGALRWFLLAHGVDDSSAVALGASVARRARAHPFRDVGDLASLGLPLSAITQTTFDKTEGISTSAPPAVLKSTGLSDEAVALLTERNRDGRPVQTLAALADLLAPSGMGAPFQALGAVLQFHPTQLLIRTAGWVDNQDPSPRDSITLLVRWSDGRLAVLRSRER